MKLFKSLALTVLSLSITPVYAENSKTSEDIELRFLRSRPAENDLLQLPSVGTAKNVIKTKKILESRYEKLENAQQKQQKKFEKAQAKQLKNREKINAIEAFSPDIINEDNVLPAFQMLFLYPGAKNPGLEKAIDDTIIALKAKGEARKYVYGLDHMFRDVGRDAKHYDLNKEGLREAVRPTHLHVKKVFAQPKAKKVTAKPLQTSGVRKVTSDKPQKRLFARRMKVWTKEHERAAAA